MERLQSFLEILLCGIVLSLWLWLWRENMFADEERITCCTASPAVQELRCLQGCHPMQSIVFFELCIIDGAEIFALKER
ncbi:hypothetical protein Mapa_003158 [Marchantia paleacea]|nr:hypothetical protein Mapa_003158 [Marchantia paleacea]